MAQLRWTLAAQQDLLSIAEFISKDSWFYAVNVVEDLVRMVESLPALPFRGRIVPEYGREELRELIHGNYRLVYRVSSDGADLIIVRVIHAARHFIKVLGKEPWIVE